jgi:acetylglutamate kinase
MYKSIKNIKILLILTMVMGILSCKLLVLKNKSTRNVNQSLKQITQKTNVKDVGKYGYSEMLECISENSDFKVKSINMRELKKCSVEVIYSGDIKSLYSSLHYLVQSKNLIGINTISISKETKTANISIDFIKNK